jgi:hypothetical protein
MTVNVYHRADTAGIMLNLEISVIHKQHSLRIFKERAPEKASGA